MRSPWRQRAPPDLITAPETPAIDIVTVLQIALAVLLILIGVAGLVLPALPGAPVLFGGLFVAAWAEGFTHVGSTTLIVLGVLTALTFAVDFAASALGAKRYGASVHAILGATAGAIAGMFFLPVGLFAGPFLGAAAGEWLHRRDAVNAGRVGFGAVIGTLIGIAGNLGVGLTMIGVFLAARFAL